MNNHHSDMVPAVRMSPMREHTPWKSEEQNTTPKPGVLPLAGSWLKSCAAYE